MNVLHIYFMSIIVSLGININTIIKTINNIAKEGYKVDFLELIFLFMMQENDKTFEPDKSNNYLRNLFIPIYNVYYQIKLHNNLKNNYCDVIIELLEFDKTKKINYDELKDLSLFKALKFSVEYDKTSEAELIEEQTLNDDNTVENINELENVFYDDSENSCQNSQYVRVRKTSEGRKN